jgi:hypothetical protein
MIRSFDLLIFLEKINLSGRPRFAISSTHLIISTYYSTASSIFQQFSRTWLRVCVSRRLDVQNRFVSSYAVQSALLRRSYVALKALNRVLAFTISAWSMIDRDSTIFCWVSLSALFAFFRIFACLAHMIISLTFEALLYATFFLEVFAD